ncbi:MAG: hypothetical protein WA974_12565 [Thermodesulfobacteriota bacterium]
MKPPIKILHIDACYQAIYTIIRDVGVIRSTLPTKTALTMLENETFDLILSEPQSMVVFTSQTTSVNLEPIIKYFPGLLTNSNPATPFSRFHLENKKLTPCKFNDLRA